MTSSPAAREQRFAEIYREHYSAVFRYVRRRAGPLHAEEIVAEVFANAWANLDRLPRSAPGPGPWLYRVASNLIVDQWRAASRASDKHARDAASTMGLGGRDPAETVTEREAVVAAFARLDDRDREVLRLVAWDDLPQREAASVLGMTRPAFAMRLHRARQRLARHIDDLECPAEAPIHPALSLEQHA